jgi:hypothetical protein
MPAAKGVRRTGHRFDVLIAAKDVRFILRLRLRADLGRHFNDRKQTFPMLGS